MQKLEMLEIKNKFIETINNKQEKQFYCVADKDYVFNGLDDDFNETYCADNNITILNLEQSGGTIITSKGNVGIAIFRYDGWQDGEKLITALYNYLKEKINNLSIDGNDLLVDDKYKVASHSSKNVGDKLILTTMQISINVNLELINNICLKPMKKIPKGLSDYGIITDEIIRFIENYYKIN